MQSCNLLFRLVASVGPYVAQENMEKDNSNQTIPKRSDLAPLLATFSITYEASLGLGTYVRIGISKRILEGERLFCGPVPVITGLEFRLTYMHQVCMLRLSQCPILEHV
jgi:hypothetical protein